MTDKLLPLIEHVIKTARDVADASTELDGTDFRVPGHEMACLSLAVDEYDAAMRGAHLAAQQAEPEDALFAAFGDGPNDAQCADLWLRYPTLRDWHKRTFAQPAVGEPSDEQIRDAASQFAWNNMNCPEHFISFARAVLALRSQPVQAEPVADIRTPHGVAIYSVHKAEPQFVLPYKGQDSLNDDGGLGEHWGGTEPLYPPTTPQTVPDRVQMTDQQWKARLGDRQLFTILEAIRFVEKEYGITQQTG